MKRIILIFSLLLALTSCDKEDLPNSDVQYSLIAKGDSFPNDESLAPRHLIIKDQKAWEKLITEMNVSTNLSKDFKEINIDFNHYQVIAVIDKTQNTEGHSIDIVEITENRNTIIVKVEKLRNGNSTLKLSRPYDIIKTDKTDKKVIFEQ